MCMILILISVLSWVKHKHTNYQGAELFSINADIAAGLVNDETVKCEVNDSPIPESTAGEYITNDCPKCKIPTKFKKIKTHEVKAKSWFGKVNFMSPILANSISIDNDILFKGGSKDGSDDIKISRDGNALTIG